jgi:hypothetical protein
LVAITVTHRSPQDLSGKHRWELLGVLGDRRLLRGSLPWVIAIFAVLNILVFFRHKTIAEDRKKNLLVIMEKAPTEEARWDLSVGEDPGRYWSSIPDAKNRPLVILAGMSQMYAINDAGPQDKTISEHMDDALSPRGIRVFGMAAPNLCNEEAILLLLSTMGDPRTHPAVFIYGVCFDKFRNIDLRPGYQAFLKSRPVLRSLWGEAAKEYAEKYPKACEKMIKTLSELGEKKDMEQESVDTRLRGWASNWLPVVSARSDLNAGIQLQLFLLRNWLLDIKPTSKRPVIEGRYQMNREFLGMMEEIARRGDVKLVFYVIPLNPLAENPFIPEQYVGFKAWLEKFCRDRDVPFANFENVVPSEAWGEFMGGPDFKHFREEGHRLTASALLDRFGPVFQRSSREMARKK